MCLSEYNNGEEVKRLRCRHIFHGDCIDPWLKVRFSPFVSISMSIGSRCRLPLNVQYVVVNRKIKTVRDFIFLITIQSHVFIGMFKPMQNRG